MNILATKLVMQAATLQDTFAYSEAIAAGYSDSVSIELVVVNIVVSTGGDDNGYLSVTLELGSDSENWSETIAFVSPITEVGNYVVTVPGIAQRMMRLKYKLHGGESSALAIVSAEIRTAQL
jgi:hypothetical protein